MKPEHIQFSKCCPLLWRWGDRNVFVVGMHGESAVLANTAANRFNRHQLPEDATYAPVDAIRRERLGDARMRELELAIAEMRGGLYQS